MVRLTVKLPVPVPLLAWLPLTVGLGLVPQQTPRSVTALPPWSVTVPWPLAVVKVMSVTLWVVTTGRPSSAVKLTSAP